MNLRTLVNRRAIRLQRVKVQSAITDETQFGQLLRDIAEYDGWPTIKAALLLLAYTCVYPSEVRGAVRSEFEREKAVWHIPAERTKTGQPHDVPLSKQALAVLDDIWPLSEGGSLVFPSMRSKDRPLLDSALNSALRRMGYTRDKMTAHGFRVTARSILSFRGYDPDVIEEVFLHQDNSSIRRTYNHANYFEQRVELMREWGKLLESWKREGRERHV